MPGFDRTQEALIAQTLLNGKLDQYLQVAQKMQMDQAALLAELVQKNFKKPAVFDSLNFLDYVSSYDLVGSDWITQNLLETGIASAGCFQIQDADSIRIAFSFFDALTSPSQSILMAALSVDQTPVPADSFFLIPQTAFFTNENVTGSGNNQNFWYSEIPVSGYRYLHLCGSIAAQDLIYYITRIFAGQYDNNIVGTIAKIK
jgi:hypothetical protein